MEIPQLTETELAPYLNQQELIELTAQQLIKDFDLYGEKITFSGNSDMAYAELFKQIKPIITEAINKNFEKLLQLLYLIDVSEKRVRQSITENPDSASAITRLIIYRELQKVIIRKNFAS